jgi:LysR family transcriptional regulator, glycine cleavage system transcriptional activator
MGVALETTRLAERELTRGDLVEFGPGVFTPFDRETHFLTYRANERNLDKVKLFRDWLADKTGLAAQWRAAEEK